MTPLAAMAAGYLTSIATRVREQCGTFCPCHEHSRQIRQRTRLLHSFPFRKLATVLSLTFDKSAISMYGKLYLLNSSQCSGACMNCSRRAAKMYHFLPPPSKYAFLPGLSSSPSERTQSLFDVRCLSANEGRKEEGSFVYLRHRYPNLLDRGQH